MIRKPSISRATVLLTALGLVVASLSGCGGGGGGGGGGGSAPPPVTGNLNRAVCQAKPHTHTATWTILVYMNAANDLQPDSLINVAQMMSVGSDTKTNIVLQWKQAQNCPFYGGSGCGNPSFVGVHRYLISNHSQTDVNAVLNGDTSSLDNGTDRRLPDPPADAGFAHADMGLASTLQAFVTWGVANFKADNIALVIWDHGSAALPARSVKKQVRTRAVSQDFETNSEINTEQLPAAVASNPVIDMILFDCSLEQTAEVPYELRNSGIKVMVASEESPPAAGYPYSKWIADLKSNGTGVCQVGQDVVNDFVAAYPNSPENGQTTQSMIDLTMMNSVGTAIDGLSQALIKHVNDQATVIANARDTAQSYEYVEQKDLFSVADILKNTATTTDIKTAATTLETALTGTTGAVILSNHGSVGQSGSRGLAIYFPLPGQSDPRYTNMQLGQTQNTHWFTFLSDETQ